MSMQRLRSLLSPSRPGPLSSPGSHLQLLPLAAAVLLFIGLSGCDSLGFGIGDEKTQYPETVAYSTLESGGVATESLDGGAYSDIKEGVQTVLRTDEGYAALWERIHANRSTVPDRPPVNFEEQVVVAIILGERQSGGYSVSIDGVQANGSGDRLQVSFTETVPGDECGVTTVLTSPYVLAAVDADGEFAFDKQTSTRRCE